MCICTVGDKPMIDNSHHDLLAQVASMYYERELTQNDIAVELDVSRVKVYRLLKQARAEGVVQITINWPLNRDLELEHSLEQAFGLKEARVLQTMAADRSPALAQVGRLCASYLERILVDGSTMAVCLGRTSYETINQIDPDFQASIRVAQAVGSLPSTLQSLDSATLARQLAQKLGGDVLYLTCPLMGDSVAASQVISSQRDIKQTLQAAAAADVALVGIGNLDPAISGFSRAGFISAEGLNALTAAGAAGDMAGRIYTLAGALFPCEYNERVIGITLAALKQIPLTIAVATGRDKARAILGALRTGAIDVLCIDDQAAADVLRIASEQVSMSAGQHAS
jgi:DNA-binding transcriptional regulator LsrR (DeoR family)